MLIGGAAMAEAGGESGGAPARGEAFRGNHAPKPLPFDPKKLPGLSEKLLVSHHDKNYAGAVKNLNDVEAALAKVGADTPGFTVAALEDHAEQCVENGDPDGAAAMAGVPALLTGFLPQRQDTKKVDSIHYLTYGGHRSPTCGQRPLR